MNDKREPVIFKLEADTEFWATDIDDACLRLAHHFLSIPLAIEDQPSDFLGLIEIKKAPE